MKYEFDKQLKGYSHFHVPIAKPIIALSDIFLGAAFSTRRPIKGVKKEKVKIPATYAEDGRKTPIDAILYTPKGSEGKTLPCVLFLHGGGFVFRAAPHHFIMAERIALKAECKVLLPNYRTAPKSPFPAAVFDALSAYKWILSEGKEHGISPENTAVAGDSAGGNLAAALSVAANERGLQPPKAQLLFYPVLDGRMNTESMATFTDTPMCSSKDMAKYYFLYARGVKADDKYLSPALLKNFSFLPPTYIEAAEYDCLRDEALSYAAVLQKSGVETVMTEVKGAMHGYDIAKNSDMIKNLTEKRIKFIKEHLTSL